MDFLSADSLPWLQSAQARLRAALAEAAAFAAAAVGARTWSRATGELDQRFDFVRVAGRTSVRRVRILPAADGGQSS
jgi:endonuclease/exonuclease/phosphatase family metal-dependent hydrolase